MRTPGFCLANATSSCTEATGSDGATASTHGMVVIWVTPAKSRTMS